MTREILTQGQEIVEELDKLFKMQDDWNDAIKLNQISKNWPLEMPSSLPFRLWNLSLAMTLSRLILIHIQ